MMICEWKIITIVCYESVPLNITIFKTQAIIIPYVIEIYFLLKKNILVNECFNHNLKLVAISHFSNY